LLAPPAAALPAVPAAPNLNARALAAAGVLSQLGGLPDIFKPLENFYYQSPGYKGQVATAEAAARSPFEMMLQDRTSANALRNALTEAGWSIDANGNAAPIPNYNNVAEAKARSVALGTGAGQLPGQLALEQQRLINELAKDNKQLVIGLDGKPTIVALPGGAETAAAAAGAKAKAEQDAIAERERQLERFRVDPNAIGPQAAAPGAASPPAYGPGATEPLPTERGTTIPPVTQATPIVGSPKYLEQRQTGPEGWTKTEGGWATALPSTVMGEQRALAIANAMKQYQTGAFASNLSEIRASLSAVGVQLPENVAGDPAKAQEILKNAFGSTLEVLKGFSARPTQNEVTLSLKNWANPDLQPEANLKIISQTVGQMRWERALMQDFAQAKQYGWRDPQDFQAKWAARPENKLQTFVDKAEQEIGPLKGMGATMTDAIRADALDHINRGANRDAVIKRLRDSGFNPAGL
jgi:hypothetical protein